MDVGTVIAHIKKNGFKFNYHVWVFQGESRIYGVDPPVFGGGKTLNQYPKMVITDVGPLLGMNYDVDDTMDDVGEAQDPETQCFYDMLKSTVNEL